MRIFSFFCIALISLCLQSTSALAHNNHSISTIVETENGKAEGVELEGFDVIAWKGLPYAKPPVEDLRWKKPHDADDWEGVRDASAYGNRCRGNEEDCLYLNVWRPTDDGKGKRGNKGKLPVFFYIHGGSNTGGSGQAAWETTAQEYNAVVVSINYRVGAMGWFSHPALKSGDLLDDSGNFGLLDQVKALQWVQDNIGNFGGDRKNVTIVGASAGAQNVSYLMHTHLARDLFHKAIMESNYPGIRPVSAAHKSSAQALYNLLVADGSAADTMAAKALAEGMSDTEIRDYFYSKSRTEIRGVYANGYWGGINWGDFYRNDLYTDKDALDPPSIVQGSQDRPEFVYTIGDGYVMPNDIDFADFSAGRGYPKPTVIGTTKNENNAWNAYWPFNFQQGVPLGTLVDQAVNDGFWYLHPVDGWTQYPGLFGDTPEAFMANYSFATELIDELDMYLGAQLLARNMAKMRRSPPVYVYRFDWGATPKRNYNIPEEEAWKFYVGAPHVQEYDFFWQRFVGHGPGDSAGGYEFNEDNLKGRQALSEVALSYLSEFIHNKNGKIKKKKGQKTEWKPWTKRNEQFIVFDGDYKKAHIKMNKKDIYRTPQELYEAYLSYPDPVTRDFIAYYVMWSWHYNWFPSGAVDPFDTSPGPNDLFDPSDP
jgi:para-nitrobenzyl esterase